MGVFHDVQIAQMVPNRATHHISIAFGKVWHESLLYKLRSMGISEELYNLLGKYILGRFQRVILNEKSLLLRPVLAGVP